MSEALDASRAVVSAIMARLDELHPVGTDRGYCGPDDEDGLLGYHCQACSPRRMVDRAPVDDPLDRCPTIKGTKGWRQL